MSLVTLNQNTPEWVKWRSKGLGASDAPIVMGKSPWTTPFELWAQKTGLIEREAPNEYQQIAMDRGHELEPIARAIYEKESGFQYPPTCFEYDGNTALRVSLDGYNQELNCNLEIKCPGKVDHAVALSGKIPSKYIPQVQMQMAVSGATKTIYMSYRSETDYRFILVNEDKAYQQELLAKMGEFWKLVETKTPPVIPVSHLKYVLALIRHDFDRVENSFKVLTQVCEAIAKGDK